MKKIYNINIYGALDGAIGGYFTEESFSKNDIEEFKELVENLNHNFNNVGVYYEEELYSMQVLFEDGVKMLIYDKNDEPIASFEYNPRVFEDNIPIPGLVINTYPTISFIYGKSMDYDFIVQVFRIFVATLYYKKKLWSKKCVHGRFVRVSNVGELLNELERIPLENRVYVGKEGIPFAHLDNKGVHFYSYLKGINEQSIGKGNKCLTNFNTIEDLIDILKRVPRNTNVYTSIKDKVYLGAKYNSDSWYIDESPYHLYEDKESED